MIVTGMVVTWIEKTLLEQPAMVREAAMEAMVAETVTENVLRSPRDLVLAEKTKCPPGRQWQ
jgi:hypothetical protein